MYKTGFVDVYAPVVLPHEKYVTQEPIKTSFNNAGGLTASMQTRSTNWKSVLVKQLTSDAYWVFEVLFCFLI